jgi:TolB protein
MMRVRTHRGLARFLWMVWLCVGGLTAIPGQAQDRPIIEVTPGKARSFRVAVQRFASRESATTSERLGQLKVAIEDALSFNVVLKPLPDEAFLGADATVELAGGPRFDCADWTQSGAQGLIEGEVVRERSELRVSFAVWDTARCVRLLEGSHSGPPRELLRLGKRVADDAVGAFTGSRGVAASEIAFISTRTGRREVFVMNSDGSEARPATRSDVIKAFPDWLPDAGAILYTRYLKDGVPALFLSSRSDDVRPGQILLGVLPGVPKYRGVFSPDGDDLALVSPVEGSAEIFRVHRDGKKLRRLTHSSAIDISPTWSPDGKQIAFVSDRFGTPQIFVMDSDGENPRRISYQSGYSASPDWSPDGRWIAYEVRAETQFDIYLVDPLGEVTVPLVTHERNDQSPSWSPDSRKIVFASDRRGRWDLYVLDLGVGTLKRLTYAAGNNTAPAWGPFPP